MSFAVDFLVFVLSMLGGWLVGGILAYLFRDVILRFRDDVRQEAKTINVD